MKTALVLGLGKSGAATAAFLARRGWEVSAADERGDLPAAAELSALGVKLFLAADPPSGPFGRVVKSPGIPLSHPWVAPRLARGEAIESDIELARGFFAGKILAVTGTMGKSSVAKALADILSRAGQTAVACGNYGVPVATAIAENPGAAWLVVEASSFQLEGARDFASDIAVLVNLEANHLDRHGSFAAYKAAKMRLFAFQRPGAAAVVPAGPLAEEVRATGKARVMAFSAADAPAAELEGTYFGRGALLASAAAVLAAAEAAGVARETALAGLRSFVPLPHRSGVAAERDGVRFVDDSKATCLAATAGSAAMWPAGTVWLLAGGRLKESDFAPSRDALAPRIRKAFLFGEAGPALAEGWKGAFPLGVFPTVAAATEAAWKDARAAARETGETQTVLLAPGATSFDAYHSCEERGDDFARAARAL